MRILQLIKYAVYIVMAGVLIWGGTVALHELRLRTLSFAPDFSLDADSTQSDWSFVVLPDLHNAEGYLQDKAAKQMTSPEDRQAKVAAHTALYRRFAEQFDTDIAIVPGDLMDGEWFTPDLETRYRPELHYKDRVRAAADIVYGSFLTAAEQAGFDTILVATGDHEYGDDPWAPLSRRDASIPVFRELFARYFGDRAAAEFSEVGTFSTPVGTAFEGTSYAVRINNALIVTVDMFLHTESRPGQALNLLQAQLQTITGTVEGAHLRWLESVLAAGRADSSIEHIFVQGHLPVLPPVRSRGSSVMYFDDGADSAFWQLLRDYEVDAYFGGEVHSDTLIKDSETPLIQVTTRAGIPRSMVTAVHIQGDGFVITQYGQSEDNKLFETGRFQRLPDGQESASGVLSPLDRDGPVLHYDFDGATQGGIANRGSFGVYYDLRCTPCNITDAEAQGGVLTEGAAYIGGRYISPAFLRSQPTTVALRFRSEDEGRSIIFSAADAGLNKGFALFLDGGALEFKHFHKHARIALDTNLADGEWHHLILRHNRDDPLLDLTVTVDGTPHPLVAWDTDDSPTWRDRIITWRRGLDSPPNHALSLGGHVSIRGGQAMSEFQGDIDEFMLWGRALADQEIERLAPRP